MEDGDIIGRYRLNRQSIVELCNELENDIQKPTRQNQSLPVSLQILIALRFYASGSFQAVVGDIHGVHQTTVSAIIRNVTSCIARRAHNYIKFPENLNQVKRRFYEYGRFPNVVGAIDGSLIPIQRPSQHEFLYESRKGGHAINIQIVSEPNKKILSASVKYPATAHDSFIWNNSELFQKFQDGEMGNGTLLGDSGYA